MTELNQIVSDDSAYFCDDCKLKLDNVSELFKHRLTHTKLRPGSKDLLFFCPLCATDWIGSSLNDTKSLNKKAPSFKKNLCYVDFSSRLSDEQERLYKAARLRKHLYVCPHCTKKFSRRMDLCHHVDIMHLVVDSSYPCDDCSNKFTTKNQLSLHRLDHIEKSLFCSLCSKLYETRIQLKFHCEIFHSNADKKFDCEHCTEQFISKELLRQHRNIHRDLCVICPHCEESLPRRRDLNRHLVAVHGNKDTKFPCSKCQKIFGNRDYLMAHMKTHSVSECPTCLHCEKTFALEDDLQRHMNLFHTNADKLYPCRQCARVFTTSQLLENHIHQHTNNRHHECEICKKKFNRRQHLLKHMDRIHVTREEIITCDVCQTKFKNKEILRIHKRLHTNNCFMCPICELKFVHRSKLTTHIERVHTIKEDKKYACDVCPKVFGSDFNLKRHYQLHVGECYVCPQCPKKFANRSYLKKHITRAHKERDLKFPCSLCDKVFSRKENLRYHQNIHSDNFFFCPFCPKKFSRRGVLNYHIKHMHTQQDQVFPCDLCDKVFTKKENLRYHKNNHSGIRFECQICFKSYTCRSSLRKHVVVVHNEKPDDTNCKEIDSQYAKGKKTKS